MTHPEKEPKDDEERKQVEKFQALQELIQKRLKEKRQKEKGESQP